jgi:pyridoxamine 5'-phosphate oxidase
MEDLSTIENRMIKVELLETSIPENPIASLIFGSHEVEDFSTEEVNAMTVSTIGVDGFRSRVVILKQYNEEGFIFTQIIIQKGKAIESNPNVYHFRRHCSF